MRPAATWSNINAHTRAVRDHVTQNSETVFGRPESVPDSSTTATTSTSKHVYPSLQVGLDSTSTLLQTARNTIDQLTAAWNGGNAPTTFYAAAAAVGYNPTRPHANMHDEATNQSYNNMSIHHSGGGIENMNVTTSGVDEMLLQSFQNDIKVFPDWPSEHQREVRRPPRVRRLPDLQRAGEQAVQYVRVVSQTGGNFAFTNPWPNQTLVLYRNGTAVGTLSGSRITVTTSVNDTLRYRPERDLVLDNPHPNGPATRKRRGGAV